MYGYWIDINDDELDALARGVVPPALQDAAIALLRQSNQSPAQAVEARPIPAGKACVVCGLRWAQPNTGGKCVGCSRRSLCPHGKRPDACNACDQASDFAYDAHRERSR